MASIYKIEITESEQIVSECSFAILGAIEGFSLEKPNPDKGIDFSLREMLELFGSRMPGSPILEFQVKSIYNVKKVGDEIVYSLDNRVYNNCIQRNILERRPPLILILVCFEEPPVLNWLSIDESKFHIKENIYWWQTDLNNEKDLKNNPDSKTTIKIPQHQRVTKGTLLELVTRFGKI